MSGIKIYSKEVAKNYDAFVSTLFEGLVIEGKSVEDYLLDKLKGGIEIEKDIYVMFDGVQYEGNIDGSTLTLTHPSGTFIGDFSSENGRYSSGDDFVVFKDDVLTANINNIIKQSSIEIKPDWWNEETGAFAKNGLYRIVPDGDWMKRIEITVRENGDRAEVYDRVLNINFIADFIPSRGMYYQMTGFGHPYEFKVASANLITDYKYASWPKRVYTYTKIN